ncbi:MAG TPA: type II toxin-antitoxin system VapC family toxin [Candidatus Limnocylindria bacterium]|nr:type II toxin-antitoxin system VapC family toxin [Candidatus Limnocylindria bacterium]
MAAIFLDTTVLVDALRGGPAGARVRVLRRDGFTPFVCAINVDELWRGARGPTQEKEVARLLRGLRVVPLRAEEGERAGRWRRDFGARGITLGQADCLIAAAAVTVGARLATANVSDFPMPELVVEDWSDSR